MKFRESGMPNEEMWDTFFNPEAILGELGLKKDLDLVDGLNATLRSNILLK